MKKAILLAVAAMWAASAFAQEPAKGKKVFPSPKSAATAAPVATARTPTGPSGLGPIKLGMTKTEVEALESSGGTFLVSPLTQFESREPLPSGVTVFKGVVRTPLNSAPFDTSFTFGADERLSSVAFALPESALDSVKQQIAEKYGAGKVDDDRKEEQCVYRNGANFKVMSGSVLNTWMEPISSTEQIVTKVLAIHIEVCPSNLRYGSSGPIKTQSLSISRAPIVSPDKRANLF